MHGEVDEHHQLNGSKPEYALVFQQYVREKLKSRIRGLAPFSYDS